MDDRVPERRDSHASSSHELSLEPARSVDCGKHSVETHFPKDRNWEICQRTNITRVPCRRRIGGAVPRADNEAVIKMIIKGRSPTMRHVSRTHRVALDWLFDRINLDPKIQIKYIDTKNHLADILTKGNFTRYEWNHLFCLFNISHFSSINNLEAMSKRTQEDAGEERVEWKSGDMLGTRTGRPVGGQPFTQHTDKFVIDDDDMDSDTATESNLSFKSRSFLHRVNDRLRKMLDHSKRCNARRRQTFFNLGNVYVFDMGSICIHGKELLRKFTFHQKYSEQSHFETDV